MRESALTALLRRGLAAAIGLSAVIASIHFADDPNPSLRVAHRPQQRSRLTSRPPAARASAATHRPAPGPHPRRPRAEPAQSRGPGTCGRKPTGGAQVGVEPGRIVLSATVPGRATPISPHSATRAAIGAAVDRVNHAGGVCGRRLEVEIVEEPDDAAERRQTIRRLAGRSFALVAMPATRGLEEAISEGELDRLKIPVIGTPGTTGAEFASDWVWPIGPGDRAYGRVAVRHAFERTARRFALIYEDSPFGRRVRAGVREAIASQPGAVLVSEQGIAGERPSYGSEWQRYRAECAQECDAIIAALAPSSLITWLASRPSDVTVRVGIAVPPSALRDRFAETCGGRCADVLVWTGFEAPTRDAGAAALRYRQDMAAADPHADPLAVELEAAYAAVLLSAQALRASGAAPTRTDLRAALDSHVFDVGITARLAWRQTRFGNRVMRGYRPLYEGGRFVGWSPVTGWKRA